jgi:hypothetical protein
LIEALERESPLSKITSEELKNFQQVLGLTDEDVARIETSILSEKEPEYLEQPEDEDTPKSQIQNSNSDDLSSEKNVDYTRLRDLLADGKWKEADEETLAVLFKAAAQEHEGFLDIESIETFPCADLRTIDRLWVKYSNGRFGFSVQKRIWENVVRESVGLKPSEYYFGYDFGKHVGWCVKGEWLDESELTYGENAPEGHLPTYCLLNGHGWEFQRRTISSLASRLVSCM